MYRMIKKITERCSSILKFQWKLFAGLYLLIWREKRPLARKNNLRGVYQAVRSTLRRAVKNRSMAPPHPYLMIELCQKCNVNCIFCLTHSNLIKNTHTNLPIKTQQQKDGKIDPFLDFDKFKAVVEELGRLKPKSISLSGNGETLLYPKLLDAITHIKTQQKLKTAKISFSTNGLLLNNSLSKELITAGINGINFSINASTPETYMTMHSINGNEFYKLKNNIRFFVDAVDSSNRKKPHITATFALCTKNYREMPKMIDLCHNLGIRRAGFRLIYFCKGKRECLKEFILEAKQKEELKCLAFEALLHAENKKIFTNLNSFINILKKDNNNYFLPKISDAYTCQIHANGLVSPYDFPYVMGDIYKDSLVDIWRSRQYVEFRNTIKEKTLNKELLPTRPFCFNCDLNGAALDSCNIIS